jgi:hypothetical protein
VIMHINLSLTTGFLTHEAEFMAGLAARGITILNGGAADIRKRTMHELCTRHGLPSAVATREGPPDEQVIIKTNLNCAGNPERWALEDGGSPSAPFVQGLNSEMRNSKDYRICLRRDVPDTAWLDPSLVVERFIGNPEGVFFRVSAIGRATMVSQVWTKPQIKKLSGPVEKRVNHFYWYDEGVHTAIGPSNDFAAKAVVAARRLADAVGVDYHATDCVMDSDGSIVAIDVNKTPWWGSGVRPGAIQHYRHGLNDLLRAVD